MGSSAWLGSVVVAVREGACQAGDLGSGVVYVDAFEHALQVGKHGMDSGESVQ